ncbi:MAG: LamG domain-containing protein [Verrucomicrobia bacterium]|nr:LamG domain-containing protein [Verrucomicrobiota bacterium]MCH8513116.1 LamG domain-containing protein [Kiritimatiellia bacterium]
MQMKTTITTLSALLLGMATSASAATIYAAWDLNEGSGNTTTQFQRGSLTWNQVTNTEENLDATDSANFSTASGLTWGGASTAPGSTASLLFNGDNDTNTLNTNVSGSGLDGTGAKTFVAWINPTAGNGSIISYSPKGGATNGADLRLLIDGDGYLRAEVSGGFLLNDSKDFRDEGWNMVAVIFDGNTNTSSFYVGGTGILSPTSFGARPIDTNAADTVGDNSNPNIIIGGDQLEDGRGFTGGNDMVGIYNGALTETELDAIFTGGVAIPEPSTIVLLGIALGSLAFLRPRR